MEKTSASLVSLAIEKLFLYDALDVIDTTHILMRLVDQMLNENTFFSQSGSLSVEELPIILKVT